MWFAVLPHHGATTGQPRGPPRVPRTPYPLRTPTRILLSQGPSGTSVPWAPYIVIRFMNIKKGYEMTLG